MTIEPAATPQEIAAIVAVLGVRPEAAPAAPPAHPSAWREAALREAVRPFAGARGERN